MADLEQQVTELLSIAREIRAALAGGPMLPLVLTKRQAARELGIGLTELGRLISVGQLRVIRYSETGHPRLLTEEVLRFLSERADAAPVRAAKARRPSFSGVSAKAMEAEIEKLRAARVLRRTKGR